MLAKYAKGQTTVDGDVGKITFNTSYMSYDRAHVQVGSVVILRNPVTQGQTNVARITAINEDVATIAPPLPALSTALVFLVYQEDVPASPTMAAMSARTSLSAQ